MSNPSAVFVSRRLQAAAAALLCLCALRLIQPPPAAVPARPEVRGAQVRGALAR